ncbi:hypothetical protein, partial [Pseudomonas sp. RA_15y_Pfl2_54]|uniref:hypothetical protein n=1 Tax=Pseudomonas sp. RA_15y_Pfl2_54 TaxID=3088704 RepID=UPI0030D83767
VWPDKKLGADGHCDVEPGSAAADQEKSGIVRRRRDNNLEKRRRLQSFDPRASITGRSQI